MGSWLTFDVGNDASALQIREQILRVFFACGGRVIDSSPMYGSSQSVIGKSLSAIGDPPSLFAADKVWTSGEAEGKAQILQSQSRWQIPKFNLLQVHNLVDWTNQLRTLFEMKERGDLRYVGITSYDGLKYDQLEQIMKSHPVDFVQLTYNIADRRAEQRLLPLARDEGIAVIVNRPFQEGRLIDRVRRLSLPLDAGELGARSWAQYMLQFIISHPAVTVAIPATSCVKHMRENIAVLKSSLPDGNQRIRMAKNFPV